MTDPAKPVTPKRTGPEPIPVKQLLMRPQLVVNLPDNPAASAIKASPAVESKRARYEIEYQPWIRHHKVTYFAPGETSTQVIMVPESWCTWTPAE